MRLDLADLHLFLCIVEAGSITQGAALAHLAPASASERLRNIEADVGLPLLLRHARGVAPTEAGAALAHHARRLLRQRATMRSELQGFVAGLRGTLRLYANTAALTTFLPPRLGPWLAERPHLSVNLTERTSEEIVAGVRAGHIEAGIVTDAVNTTDLVLQPVASDHLVLLVPTQHPLAGRRRVRFADVVDEPFVGLAAGHALQTHLEAQAQAAGRALAYRVRMKTFDGLCEMVACGVGIGIVPRAVARELRRRHPCAMLTLVDPWAQRQLCLCFQQWDALAAPLQGLLLHLGGTAPAPAPSQP